MPVESKTVGQKVFTGTLWMVAMRMSIRFIGIISVIILARILDPADFGLVAKAVMIQSFLELVTALGLESALIKDQSADESHYNTAWTIHILRGGFIGIVLTLFAVPISIYLNSPDLELIIYCYAFVSFLSGFYNIRVVDFRKQLIFSVDFKYNIYKKLSGFITTITIALIWETYWALVAGVVVSTLVSVISSFIMCPTPVWFSISRWRSLFAFSKWMLGYELIGAISAKIDTFMLSIYSSTENVGLYTISYELAGTTSTEIAQPVARALMPGLSTLHTDKNAFCELYTSAIGIVLLLTVPAALGLSVVAEHITLTLLGEKWMAAVPIIQILALYGIPRTINATAVSGLIAFGKVDALAKIVSLTVSLKVIFIFFGIYYFGFIGLIIGVLISGIVSGLIMLILQQLLGMISIKLLMIRCWRVVVAGLLMSFVLQSYLKYYNILHSIPVPIQLIAEVLIGGSVYLFSLFVLSFFGSSANSVEKKVFEFLKLKLIKTE